MTYLIVQIFVCLLLSALLGGLVGWLLRGRGRADAADDGSLISARQRIADLEHELADCRSAPRAATPAEETFRSGRAASAAGFVSDAGAAARDAAVAGAVTGDGLFGTPAARPVDDLEAISGVGPAIAAQLAGIGVTTFRQIATFTADDIETASDAIGVSRGRIEREDWVAQAARLHAETYGTDA